ncbi:CAP domain-containing protein [Kocuria sp. M1R5S2]|uniref:CAP domain-containing protein n=1 Tax=Kocuria rhizosphaerae TaxID=3376285 RepID=UPI00379004A8
MTRGRHRAGTRPNVPARLALTAAALTLTVPATGTLSAAPAAAAAADILTVGTGTRAADAQQLLDLINAHRKAKGLSPVKYSATLSQIAQGQSDRLVREEVVDHTDDFMTDPRAGSWDAVGEVHAVSWKVSVAELMDRWKNSPAHHKILTDARMEVVGIGLTYVDGSLAGNKQAWRLAGTVASYGYPDGKAPADTRTTVPAGDTTVQTSPAVDSGYPVQGAIGRTYRALGGAPVFGEPTGYERGGLPGGGALQSFARGSTFYWSPGTGASPVNLRSAVGQKFAWAGHERGYGYPTTPERPLPGGAYQVFRSGADVHKVLWSPGTGARVVKENSAIGQRWKASGYERGYGYPATDEYWHGSEVRQRYSNGYTVHWSSVTKRTWVTR